MGRVDLRELVALPPRRAIAALRAKGLRVSWDWEDTLTEAHDRALAVAKAARADVLVATQEALELAAQEGQSLRQFGRGLEAEYRRLGFWGRERVVNPDTGSTEEVQLGSPARIKTVYRTNLQSAFARGRQEWADENPEGLPYAQYVAVLDSQTRPSHAALNGKVFRTDDPFWRSFSPPNGYNCRCRRVPRSQRWVDRNPGLLESSEGRLGSVLSPVSRRSGATELAATYRAQVGDDEVVVRPDPGWSREWQPNLEAYPPAIRAQVQRSLDARLAKIELPTGVEVPVNGVSRYRAASERALERDEAAGYRVLLDVTRNGGYVATRGATDPLDEQIAIALARYGSRATLDGETLMADGQVMRARVLWRVLAAAASGLWRLLWE